MNRENRMDELERQLRNQALMISRRHRHHEDAPTDYLLSEHRRRVRRRRNAAALGSVVVLVATLSLIAVLSNRRPAGNLARTGVPRAAVSLPEQDRDAVRSTETVSEMASSPVDALPHSLGSSSAVVTDSVPFLIIETVGGQRRVIATGLYVPERVQRVDLSDFNQVEQRAVRQVLGFENNFDTNGPI